MPADIIPTMALWLIAGLGAWSAAYLALCALASRGRRNP